MKSSTKFYVGEYGFYLSVQTGVDLNTVTDGGVRAMFRRPDGTTVAQNVPQADWTDLDAGVINVTLADGVFNRSGPYRLQIMVNIGTGFKPSHIVEFDVLDPIMTPVEAFA